MPAEHAMHELAPTVFLSWGWYVPAGQASQPPVASSR